MSEHVNEPSRRAFVFSAALFGTALATGIFNPSYAHAVTAAEKQAEADAVREQLVSLQADLEMCADKYYGALEERDAAHAAMEAEQVKIDEATLRINEIQERLGDRARNMYRTGPTGFIDFVLGSSSFEEFTTNWDLLDTVNEEDAKLVEETKQLRAQLEESKAEYERQEAIAQEKAAEAELAKNQAESRVAEATELMNQLDEEALVRILTEPKNALARQYAKLLSFDNVELEFTPEALKAIAKKALARKSGARGLRAIIESVMTETMYELPSMEGVEKCIITEAAVNGTEKPTIVTARPALEEAVEAEVAAKPRARRAAKVVSEGA